MLIISESIQVFCYNVHIPVDSVQLQSLAGQTKTMECCLKSVQLLRILSVWKDKAARCLLNIHLTTHVFQTDEIINWNNTIL